MDINELIASEEKKYNDRIAQVTERILGGNVRLVLIAGPSCSGKTTSAMRLIGRLEAAGKKAYKISLDDYYLNPSDMKTGEDGTKDYESLDSLDLELLHLNMQDLARGKTAYLPIFDFPQRKRLEKRIEMTLDRDAYCVIEGLHMLNPAVYENYVSGDSILKVYLEAYDESGLREVRFIRRLVRDKYYRATPAEQTFALWQNVTAKEKINIIPFAKNADCRINTYLAYEQAVLRNDAIEILGEIGKGSVFYEKAASLIEYLEAITPIAETAVPSDSVLQEFIHID